MPIAISSLTPDVRRYLKDGDQSADGTVPSEAVLSAIGVSISKLRDEVKAARVASGIEARWRNAEEAYAGIDDANRGDVSGGHQWTKSMSKDGPISSSGDTELNNRSTVMPRMTQRYVDAGSAKLAEILLAPGARSFSFSPTPVPDLINAKDDKRPILLDNIPGSPPAMIKAQPHEISALAAVGGAPVPAPAGAAVPLAGAAGPPAMPGAAPMRPLTPSDLAKEAVEKATKAAKKAEKRIYDWHVEGQRSAQVRKVIFDSARLGVGVLKGPFPKSSKQMATRKSASGIELGIRKVIQPASKWVNSWNFFPDAGCGEDVQEGDYVFEREWMGEGSVRRLKGLPGYISKQIDKVLIEGPQKVNVKEDAGALGDDDSRHVKNGKYETWYFHGTLTREEMGCICEAAGEREKIDQSVPADRKQVCVIVTMINDSVVRATINPLDSGEFPYHAMSWQRRTGSWAGVGVAEQIDVPQRMLTGAVRAMMDNAGVAAGGQIVIDASVITPADGEMSMSPHKIWYLNGDGDRLNVNEAFGLFRVDNVTAELMQVVELAMRLGEESTSIPLVTQGQSGPTTPNTFGGMQLQNNNANQLLRSIGYAFDDYITDPETRQYYEWLILDPDVPDDEKGDWVIDAHGSNALVEQSLQNQFIPTLAAMVLNPAYGFNPKKWAEMLVRANRLQPVDFQYTEEEQARIDSQPPPAPPQIEAAKIRAGVDEKRIAAGTADTAADNAREDRALATQATVELHTLQLKRELAMLDYANREKVSLADTKAQLAQTAMKLQVQKELASLPKAPEGYRGSSRQRTTPQVATPAIEPPGQAPPGQAFQA